MDSSYARQLESALDISALITECEKLFDIFLQNNSLQVKNEMNLLSLIKRFLSEEKVSIQNTTRGSKIHNYDCLTLSIIACTLASRKGYEVSIGRPAILSRYYHSLIIRSNGQLFKIAGHSRNYGTIRMSVKRVSCQLKCFNALIDSICFFSKFKPA